MRAIKQLHAVANADLELKYKINGIDFEVVYEYVDEGKILASGRIVFGFFILLNIESENNHEVGLPDSSSVLYEFASQKRKGFRGFKLWFPDEDFITVVCDTVQVGNEKL